MARRTVGIGAAEVFKFAEVRRVGIDRTVDVADRRPVHARRRHEHRVERGRRLGIATEREERERPHLVNHRILGRGLHGPIKASERAGVITRLELGQRVVDRGICLVVDRRGRRVAAGTTVRRAAHAALGVARVRKVAVVGDVVVHHHRLGVVVGRRGHDSGRNRGVVGVHIASTAVAHATVAEAPAADRGGKAPRSGAEGKGRPPAAAVVVAPVAVPAAAIPAAVVRIDEAVVPVVGPAATIATATVTTAVASTIRAARIAPAAAVTTTVDVDVVEVVVAADGVANVIATAIADPVPNAIANVVAKAVADAGAIATNARAPRPITTDTGPVPVQATIPDLTGKRCRTVATADAGTIASAESTASARANLTGERRGPIPATHTRTISTRESTANASARTDLTGQGCRTVRSAAGQPTTAEARRWKGLGGGHAAEAGPIEGPR